MMYFIAPAFAAGPVQIADQYAFGKMASFGLALSFLVPLLFSIAAVLVTFYLLLGAFDMIISSGDKNAVSAAQAKITHAIIGFILLIVVFLVFFSSMISA